MLLDEEASEEIFHYLLLQKNFGSPRETSHDGFLPIHYAASNKSPDFCQLLIDAYPESLRAGTENDSVPFLWGL